MSRVMNRGGVALILVVALIATFSLMWAINAQRAEATGVAVPIPGTGCTLYANAEWSSTASPPVYTEGEVQCGEPQPEPTPTSILK